MAEDCNACGSAGTVTVDPFSGLCCCCDCGVVVDDEMLSAENQACLVGERGGTLVTGEGTGRGQQFLHCHAGGGERWQAKKKSEALDRVRNLVSVLRLQPNDAGDVQAMVDRATGGEWGTGRWIGILVAACVYLVVRQNHVPLTLVEIAFAADCGVPELGRMLNKVLSMLEIALPQEDMIVFLERLVSTNSKFSRLSKEVVKKIISQSRMLLEWSQKWYLSTGRHKSPVLAAVFLVICQANGISVDLEEIADELHAHHQTAQKRHREILEAFVSVVQKFPWGKKVTMKNVSLHFGFLLRYLEASLKRQKKRKRDADAEDDDAADHERVLPKAFAASEVARRRRIAKAESAAERIAKAKEVLAGKMKKGAVAAEVIGGLRKGLDWEDLTIEYLILRGARAQEIEQGYYDSIIAGLDQCGGDQEITEEEIAKYLFSKDEILKLIQRVKMQNMLGLSFSLDDLN